MLGTITRSDCSLIKSKVQLNLLYYFGAESLTISHSKEQNADTNTFPKLVLFVTWGDRHCIHSIPAAAEHHCADKAFPAHKSAVLLRARGWGPFATNPESGQMTAHVFIWNKVTIPASPEVVAVGPGWPGAKAHRILLHAIVYLVWSFPPYDD